MSWHGGLAGESAGEYVSHLLREIGRLGLEVHDIESHARPPNTRAVLSDLVNWLGRPNESLALLFDWRRLNITGMRSRLQKDESAKPRIDVSAEISKMNNFSVRWHPGGYRDTFIDFNNGHLSHPNLIEHRKWPAPPDFSWFTGDEEPTFDARSTNELLYVRGVGNLDPSPDREYGPYLTYNRDVVDSILICAVRCAYERLIAQLEMSFEVDVVNAFDFVTRDEPNEEDDFLRQFPTHRVVSWKLQNTAQLKRIREAEQEAKERLELANVADKYGFTREALIEAIERASTKKKTGLAPTGDHANAQAAKELRKAGFKIDAGQVRRIRQLIERYSVDMLPEALRPASTSTVPPSNIVQFPTKPE